MWGRGLLFYVLRKQTDIPFQQNLCLIICFHSESIFVIADSSHYRVNTVKISHTSQAFAEDSVLLSWF